MVNKLYKPEKDDPDFRLEIKQKLLQKKLSELLESAEIKCPFYE